MKIISRVGCFETNSSSVHSIIILSANQFKKWIDGDLYACTYDCDHKWNKCKIKPECGKYYTFDDLVDLYKQVDVDLKDDSIWEKDYYSLDDYLYEDYFITYDKYMGGDFDHEESRFITPSGDEMVAICKYGYDY